MSVSIISGLLSTMQSEAQKGSVVTPVTGPDDGATPPGWTIEQIRDGMEVLLAQYDAIFAASAAAMAAADRAEDAAASDALSMGVALRTFGPVDTTGITDMAPLINAAIFELSPQKVPLIIDEPGLYRINSAILLQDNTYIICAQGVRIKAFFNSSTGMVMWNASLGYNVTTNPLHNVTIIGGDWSRNGVISGVNNEIWTGNTGNVFYFWCLDMKLQGIQISGYGVGRGFLLAGSGLVDDCHVRNYDNFLTSATAAAGGTGGFRIFGGNGLKLTRLTCVCGDDAFQFTPGQTPLDTVDCMYDLCWAISHLGRVCIAYLGSRAEADPTNSILACSFTNIRGEGTYGINTSNGESDGNLDVLLFNVVVGMHVAPPHWPHQNRSIGFDIGSGQGDHTGLATIRVRSCGLRNVIDAGLRVVGIHAALVDIDGWIQPIPTNPLSTRPSVQIQDAVHFRMNNFFVAACPTTVPLKSVIYLGRADDGTKVTLADFSNGTIANIGDNFYGIVGTADGYIEMNLDNVKFVPLAGSTLSLGVRYSDITERVTMRNCDFRLVNTAVAGGTAGLISPVYSVCRFPNANPFVLTQAAAAAIDWNGTAKLMRVTLAAPVTISTINFPAGYAFTELPVIYLTVANNVTVTLDGLGNLVVQGGSITMGLRDIVCFVWDPISVKWLQASAVSVNP